MENNNQFSISPTIILTLTDLTTLNIIKEFNSLQNSIPLGRGGKSNNFCQLKSNGLFRVDSNSNGTSTKVMSQKHALISWDKSYAFLTDVGSTNGTTIKRDGEISHLISDVAYRLKSRDVITFGKQTGGNGGDSQQNYPISVRVHITTTYSRPTTSQVITTSQSTATAVHSVPRLFEPRMEKRSTIHSSIRKKKIGYGLSEEELISPDSNTENDIVILNEQSSEDEKEKIFTSKLQHRSIPAATSNFHNDSRGASDDEDNATQVVHSKAPIRSWRRKGYARTRPQVESDDEIIQQAESEEQVVNDHDDFGFEEEDEIAAYGMEMQDQTEFIGGLHHKQSPTKIKVILPPSSPVPSQENQWIKSQELELDEQRIQQIQDFLAEESLSALDPFSDDYAVEKSRKNSSLVELVETRPILMSFSSSLSRLESSSSLSGSDSEDRYIHSKEGFDTRSSKISLAFKKAVKPSSAQSKITFEDADDQEEAEKDEEEAMQGVLIRDSELSRKKDAELEMEMEPSRQNSRTLEVESDSEELDYSSIESQPAQVNHLLKRASTVRFHFDPPTSNSSRLPSPVSPVQQENSQNTLNLFSDNDEDDIMTIDSISQQQVTRKSGKSIKIILEEAKKKELSENHHLPSPSPELGVDVVRPLSFQDVIELENAETERDDVDNGQFFDERSEVDEPDEVDLDDEVFDVVDTFGPTLTSNFHHPFNTNAIRLRINNPRRPQLVEDDSESEEEEIAEEAASPTSPKSDDQESQEIQENQSGTPYPSLALLSGPSFDESEEEQGDAFSLEDDDDDAQESQEEEDEDEEESEEDDEEDEDNEEEDDEEEEENEDESIFERNEDEVSYEESEVEVEEVRPAGILTLVAGPLLETEDEEDDTFSSEDAELLDSQFEEDEEGDSADTSVESEFYVAPNGARLIFDVIYPTENQSDEKNEEASTSIHDSGASEVHNQSKEEVTTSSSVSPNLHRYFKPYVRNSIIVDKPTESMVSLQPSSPRTSFKRDRSEIEAEDVAPLTTFVVKSLAAAESSTTLDAPVIKKRRINIPHIAIGSTIGFVSGVVATLVGLNALESYLENI